MAKLRAIVSPSLPDVNRLPIGRPVFFLPDQRLNENGRPDRPPVELLKRSD
jgi:hypothetical protein